MQERGPYYTAIDKDGRIETRTIYYIGVQDGEMETVRQRAMRHILGDKKLTDRELAWVHTISTSNPDAQFPLVTHKLITDPEGELLHEVFEGVGGLQAIIEPNPDAAGAFNLNLNSPVEHGHI